MVDRVEGFVVKNCEGAGGKGPDQERAEETGSVGDGDGVEAIPR